MNNINTILDAVGELDNTILENAFMPKKKKPVALIVIAAATALSLLVGFTTVIRNGVFFEDKQMIDFHYHSQTQANILTEEELGELGAVKEDRGFKLNVLPSELFELYNVEPLMNSEFFGEEPEVVIQNSIPRQTIIDYTLTDKESGKQMKINLQFKQTGDGTFSHGYSIIGGGNVQDIFSHYEILTLADGSEGFVSDRYLNGFDIYTAEAVFCYDGIGYRLYAKNMDIIEMKLMLERFGIIAE